MEINHITKVSVVALGTVFLFLFFRNNCFGQGTKQDSLESFVLKKIVGNSAHLPAQYRGSKLDSIRVMLEHGDKTALLKIADYFDSKELLTEFLGYHILKTPENEIAKRLLNENCLFLESEFPKESTLSTKNYLEFIKQNFDKIQYCKDAGAFLITPLEQRTARVELRKLSENKKAELKRTAPEILNLQWVQDNGIDLLIKVKSPMALYQIASAFFKSRTRFNDYQTGSEDYVNLIEVLTGTTIGVDNEVGKISYHIESDFYPESRLNLLIYFTKNYQKYAWDNKEGIYVNTNTQVQIPDKVATYYELLNSSNDAIALNAFLYLTTCNPERISALAEEYEKADIKANYSLPTFPYRFLKQLSLLTSYCKKNQIDYIGSKSLQLNISKLQERLSFVARRQLENDIIQNLTMDDVTAFEYWCIVHEKSGYLTYSAGRILDVFYSKKWSKLISDNKHLNTYLKKSKLFADLQIIGNANNYLNKFVDADSLTVAALKKDTSADRDVTNQIKIAVITISRKPPKSGRIKKFNGGNYDTVVTHLKQQFKRLSIEKIDSSDKDNKIARLLSTINFRQIGPAFELLESYKFKYEFSKYEFMNSDFGFFMSDFSNIDEKKEFLSIYKNHSEKHIYDYYLNKARIDYLNKDGALNYLKIYQILKFDVVNAFVGGGGGTQSNEVYFIIRLLEIKFKTTLGFPHKLCNSGNLYGCDARERAVEWMRYLEGKKIVPVLQNEPGSFNILQ